MKAVTTWDDIDVSQDRIPPSAKTVTLGYQGVWYELDLNELHHQELWEAIEKYISVARRQPVRVHEAPPKAALPPGGDVPVRSGVPLYHAVGVPMGDYLKALRKWCEDSGTGLERKVSDRGISYYNYHASHFRAYEAHLSEQDRTRMAG